MIRRIISLVFISFASIEASFFVAPVYTSTSNTTIARCDACHVDVQGQFSITRVHRALTCTDCHSISEFGPDLYSHNATTLECIHCHAGVMNGFHNDAHSDFSGFDTGPYNFTGSNGVCDSCHCGFKPVTGSKKYNGINMTVSVASGSLQMGSLP